MQEMLPKFQVYVSEGNALLEVVDLNLMAQSFTAMAKNIFGELETITGSFAERVNGKERYILRWYTRMEDHYGKSIFDGDIIGVYAEDGTLLYVGEVDFLFGAYGIKGRCPFHELPDCSYIVVIGNVYQNPELLGIIREQSKK